MRKLALSLLALIALCGVAQAQVVGGQQIVCTKTFQVSQGAVALTKIVTGAAGSSISLCGWAVDTGAAAATFQLQYGTGTNCGTGTTSITPAFTLPANGFLTDHVGIANISLPSVNASGVPIDLCLVTTGTGPTSILIYYQQ